GRKLLLGLEVLRLVTVVLLVVTLWRPELVRRASPNDKPEVVVLTDASRSMTTKDVVGEKEMILGRSEWVEQQLTADFWGALSNRYKVAVEEFSRASTNDEEGTDINAALEDALAKHRNLRTVVLLSDGDWNLGKSPVAAATKLQVRQVPVFAVSVGSR